MNNSKTGKTTMSFRIMPDTKLRIAGVATKLNMSPSQYIEALVMKRHNEIVDAINKTNRPTPPKTSFLNLSNEQEIELREAIEDLLELFPNRDKEELLIASVLQAYTTTMPF